MALDGVDLELAPGAVTALVGPNGAGKTTLIDTIVGFHAPVRGEVRVFGHDPATDRAELASRWSTMPQAGGLPMGLTVLETVRLFAQLAGQGADPVDLVEQVGLTPESGRRWRRLSGGQQQRLSLAVALTGGRDLLVLDEPTAALDGRGVQQLLELVRLRRDAGAAVLLTSHRADEIERLADTVVVLDEGRVRATGTVEELTAVDAIIVELDGAVATDEVEARLGRTVTAGPGRVVVPGTADQAMVPAITGAVLEAGGNITGVRVGRRPLDDVLDELTGATETAS